MSDTRKSFFNTEDDRYWNLLEEDDAPAEEGEESSDSEEEAGEDDAYLSVDTIPEIEEFSDRLVERMDDVPDRLYLQVAVRLVIKIACGAAAPYNLAILEAAARRARAWYGDAVTMPPLVLKVLAGEVEPGPQPAQETERFRGPRIHRTASQEP